MEKMCTNYHMNYLQMKKVYIKTLRGYYAKTGISLQEICLKDIYVV